MALRENLVKDGAILELPSDTETIVQLIAKSKEKILDKLIDALFQIKGGYSLIIMTNKKVIGVKESFWYSSTHNWKAKEHLYFSLRNLCFRYCWRDFY